MATLAATESLNSTTSWLTSANCLRSESMFHSRNATPSSRNSPEVGSMKRGSRFTSEDLPAPDGPTSATVSPAAIVSEKSSSALAWSAA